MARAQTIRAARREDLPVLRNLWRQLDTLHAQLQPGYFQASLIPRPKSELDEALSKANWGASGACTPPRVVPPAVTAASLCAVASAPTPPHTHLFLSRQARC